MALIGSSTSSSSQSLTLTFLNSLITSTIAAQREPITALKSKKDQLNLTKAVYSDLKTKLTNLKTIVSDLKSSDDDPVFNKKSVTSSDSSRVTATTTTSAASGTYDIKITNLAKAHIIRSEQQSSSTEGLNLSGTFMLNGKSITVGTDDSLQNIMNFINNAEYDEGKEVRAKIVDKNLIIEASSTGLTNKITASDTDGSVLASLGILDGGNIKTTLQEALDASFSVNGINVSRANNTGIDDVVEGVTINLLKQTEDSNSVTLTIQKDYTAIRAKVNAFVSNLNSTVSYLKAKTQTTASEENKTYSRGALSNDSVFSSLRLNLVNALRTHVVGEEGDPEYLSDVGITIGSGFAISLNTSKLDSAVQTNPEGVINLFDGVMAKYESLLETFTASDSASNTLDLYSNSINTKIKNMENRISLMESNLTKKEATLTKQYSSLYIQNIEFTAQQYSILNNYYSTQA